MNLKLLYLIGILLSLPFVIAESDTPTYQASTDVNITVPCTNNGTLCSNTASCEAMIINPNALKIINNQSMTQDIGFFNITIDSSNTSVLGPYEFTMCCRDSGQTKCKTLLFNITPNGQELSIPQGIIYVVVLLASLFIFCLVLYGAITLPFGNLINSEGWTISVNDLKYVKLFLWFAAYLILIWITFIAKWIAKSFLFLDFADVFFNIIFYSLLVCVLPIFTGLVIFGIWYKLADDKIQQALARGLRA